jgi:hypothetical protein
MLVRRDQAYEAPTIPVPGAYEHERSRPPSGRPCGPESRRCPKVIFAFLVPKLGESDRSSHSDIPRPGRPKPQNHDTVLLFMLSTSRCLFFTLGHGYVQTCVLMYVFVILDYVVSRKVESLVEVLE